MIKVLVALKQLEPTYPPPDPTVKVKPSMRGYLLIKAQVTRATSIFDTGSQKGTPAL
jgi:hypothetical protein